MHVFISCLNLVHSYLGIVVAAYVERNTRVYGMDPVTHLRVILYYIDGIQWQGLTV